ncbi:cyclin-dependent kinase inhibitor 7-like [Senna tora]|uniref:Cyclin-dependent kinase inhibitor 7-like n=1 Tax=Senna tora TaxID=362788 RepID=A0A834WPM4_9FABA|nr:cyclin-dependent kinase inhibitor 7-like [Senna tora]
MVRKCRRIAEINAVMEMAQVGVRNRAPAAFHMGAASSSGRTPKRRKINNDQQLKFSASSLVQLNSRSRALIQPETTLLPAPETEVRCSSPTTDELPESCCSSNGSIGLDEERIDFLDLEVENAQLETSTSNCGDKRRNMSFTSELRTKSEDIESAEKSTEKIITEVNSHCKSTGRKRPTESELEEFFGAAEKDIQKRFAEKYNYDIVNDVPLEGRYEWVKLKP